jgi:lipopolysaccharide export system ATP-binding protein
MYKRARRGIGYLSQERSDFRRLTVWQNLQAILETRSEISRSDRNRKAEQLLSQYGLTRQRNQKADTLSGGERRKLEIARALVTDPQLILLDEPFSGVDPIAVEDLQREVIRLKEEFGKSVLITDHNVAQTLKVCDRALIIEEGRVKFEGTPREVINDPGVRSAYTGNLFRGDEFDDKPAPPPPPTPIALAAARKNHRPLPASAPASGKPTPSPRGPGATPAREASQSRSALAPVRKPMSQAQPTIVPMRPTKPAASVKPQSAPGAAPAKPNAAKPAAQGPGQQKSIQPPS